MGMAQATRGNQDKGYQPVRAPRGSQLNCQGWPQEAALRLLMNSLDEDVAEQPRELIACATTGKVLRDWDSYHATVKALKGLKDDETLLVRDGEPAGVFETHRQAPRVLMVSATQTAAGSWTYVGSQGTLPIAFQTLDAVAQKHFGGVLAGKLVVSGGLGAAGGALSLATGLLGGAFLGIEADGERIKRRIRAGYCDYCVNTLDEALRILKNAVRQNQAVSVGLIGNCADVIPELASRGVVPDILTDQTSAHDLLNGYVPFGASLQHAIGLRSQNPPEYLKLVHGSIARHVEGMITLQKLGSIVFEFGNELQTAAHEAGVECPFDFPDVVAAYLQPSLREGLTPIRWIALSGESGDIRRFDDLVLKLFPDDAMLARWIPLARKYVRFQGLPARVCWLGPDARVILAERVNKLVSEGVFKAPIVIALDQWNCNSENSPAAGPAKMQDTGADGDWDVMNALLNTVSGASWVSLGSVKSSLHNASLALVADGTGKAAKRLPRVLKNDSKLGIIRRSDRSHKKA